MPTLMDDRNADERMVLRVNAPDWLEREDFRAWLRDGTDRNSENRRLAMWGDAEHPGDLFEPICAGEVSERTLLPDDIVDWIENAMRDTGMKAGVLWISFLPVED